MKLREVYIEVGDDEYGITPESYDPGEAPCFAGHPDNWDPGSGPEMDFPETVMYYANGQGDGVPMPWDVMAIGYGAERHMSLAAATEDIQDKLFEAYEDWYADDRDDGEYEDWSREERDNYDWEGE